MIRIFGKATLLMVSAVSSIVTYGQTLSLINIDTDPKVVSLGFIDTVSDNVESSVFANPAMMSFTDFKAAIECSYGYWQPNTFKENRSIISGSYKINERWCAAVGMTNGCGMRYKMYNDNGMFTGEYRPTNYHFKTGASYKLFSFLSVGINVGFVSEIMSSQHNNMGLMTDVFITSSVSDFKIATGVRNLGVAMNNAGQILKDLPVTISAGASYRSSFYGSHQVGLYAQYDMMDGDAMSASVGASYSYRRLLTFRTGGRLGYGKIPSLLSAGCSLAFNPIEINIAYVFPVNGVSLSNTISLSIVYLIR